MSTAASNTSPPARSHTATAQHTRTYQACIPCRRRKVRCDLGPVDNPHDPPCVRCRRESKECFFSATRRKRKTDDGDDYDEADDYEIRNARKRQRSDGVQEPLTITTANSAAYISQPLTPGGSIGRYEPLRRPNTSAGQSSQHNDDEDQKVNNETLATLQTGEVYSGHDALNLLFEAAGMNAHHRTGSSSSLQRPNLGSTPGSQTNFASPRPNQSHARTNSRPTAEPSVDPAIQQPLLPDPPNEAAFADAVRAWSKFRFVRAGWLTAKEAIAYIDYFYAFLSPLTPIVVPDYRDHAFHAKLLREEPMLVITLLTISARYSQPSGSSGVGATSRSYLIHEKLWKYLQGMIDRMIFGQEQFGGGFCGAGQQPGSDVNPLSRKGLRTLGTVESLMLLTEWHPRALHFPPGDDDDELVLPDDPYESGPKADMYKEVGDKRIDSWLEPCWRSDRMCWMLLGNAMTLAFEIGVFDETNETEFEEANQHLSHATVKAYYRRKNHLRDLLIIYVTQTSGRLGLTSMLPKIDRDESLAGAPSPLELYKDRISRIKAPPAQFGMRSDGQRLPLESIATQERHAIQDLVLDFWQRIAKIMEMGNLKLFSNRRKTRELLKTGTYEEMLKFFQGPLAEWRKCFDRAPQALQAVVERCTHNTPLQTHAQPNGVNGRAANSNEDGGAIPFSTLVKWYANDRHYINEVIDASRNVLKVVVDGLHPGGYLRHAPVRTFFRIVSVAIILLKTFALGATEEDVAVSLGLLSSSVDALRTSIVDDVHVGNRFADLVETLTHRIRSRFVRLTANGSTGISRAGSKSPVQAPMMPPPSALNNTNHLAPPYMGSQQTGFSASGTSVPGSPSMGLSTSGRATPLWGISSEPYDPNSNSISIMPPPGNYTNFSANTNGNNHSNSNGSNSNGANGTQWGQWANNGSGGWGTGHDQDWLALPLDPLLDQWGAEINQTAMGPDIGGMDMLDILLNMGGPPGSA
ncbi:hypothetical protein COCHEDRAFT_1143170 [Bipolaris maydis C5]|uniref:Zn(2)-C6 fungal-type domain-containing protein n=1 Tax=Cochliobolus heterostrophus (strain C5 / ATCC 48332 / race O) TaxID=701091 RepID=M2TMF8_COCH5|nr:hypothetical protein COCHEDRAFT_1143170 [Bipolaris maydis C5]KAJ6268757.1 hypothetical protein PSV08DRAFT_207651 [Bipolaris maydis]